MCATARAIASITMAGTGPAGINAAIVGARASDGAAFTTGVSASAGTMEVGSVVTVVTMLVTGRASTINLSRVPSFASNLNNPASSAEEPRRRTRLWVAPRFAAAQLRPFAAEPPAQARVE